LLSFISPSFDDSVTSTIEVMSEQPKNQLNYNEEIMFEFSISDPGQCAL